MEIICKCMKCGLPSSIGGSTTLRPKRTISTSWKAWVTFSQLINRVQYTIFQHVAVKGDGYPYERVDVIVVQTVEVSDSKSKSQKHTSRLYIAISVVHSNKPEEKRCMHQPMPEVIPHIRENYAQQHVHQILIQGQSIRIVCQRAIRGGKQCSDYIKRHNQSTELIEYNQGSMVNLFLAGILSVLASIVDPIFIQPRPLGTHDVKQSECSH